MKNKTIVYPVRSDSMGTVGMLARCRHHARALVPLIRILLKGGKFIKGVDQLGFASRGEGETVQHLNTVDGRVYSMRGFGTGKEYTGIRLFARIPSNGRNNEIPLCEATTPEETEQMLQLLGILAKPHKAEWGHKLCG